MNPGDLRDLSELLEARHRAALSPDARAFFDRAIQRFCMYVTLTAHRRSA